MRTRRAAVLLEIVLALGLFVATAMTLLGVVSGAIDSLTRSRDRLVGADHARNALARIEAGIARPESLNGPVAPWSGGDDQLAGGGSDPFAMPGSGGNSPAGRAGGAGFGGGNTPPGLDGAGSGGDPLASSLADTPTGWALEIETEPAQMPGLTLVIVRAFRADESGQELEGGTSVTLRQIVALSAAGGTDGGSENGAGGEFESGFGSGFGAGFGGGAP